MAPPAQTDRWRRRYAIGAGLVGVWLLLLLLTHSSETDGVLVHAPLPTAVVVKLATPPTVVRTTTAAATAVVRTTAVARDAALVHASGSSSGSIGHDEHHGAVSTNSTGQDGGVVLPNEKRHYVQPLLPTRVLDVLERSSMIDIMGDVKLNAACPWPEKESKSNVEFMKVWSAILRKSFPPSAGGQPDGSGLLWFLDEGGLIGSSRAGAMANADDDFDFFLILPNQHAPCRPDSITCTPEEFQKYIHKFLMVFWKAGMCINKFNPDITKFKSKNRLMYSFQLDRPSDVAPENCFIESKPFAHMHLGMFTSQGKIKTNIWALGTTHPMDELDIDVMLPVRRCRAGPVDAPCPNNITGYLTVRNRGEYRSRSGDGNCLLVRKKWGEARKIGAVKTARKLAACGYNSIVDLADAFEESGYRTC